MSTTQVIAAGCKVNLYLDIVGVRDDGYHEIESLFYPLPVPCDMLHVQACEGQGLSLSCTLPELATPKNILARAYDAFRAQTGFTAGVRLHLEKNIPMGAGLGGGSSDAAAFLLWLNEQAGSQGLSPARLAEVAVTLGADVPFFLLGEPAWVTGIGERLEPLAVDLTAYTVLVVCPDVHVDTKWAYGRWDEMHTAGLLTTRKELTLKNSLIKSLCFTNPPGLWNCFEEVVFQDFPMLYGIKEQILEHSAEACVMSGSGSSFVALFSSSPGAMRCAREMKAAGHACYGVRSGVSLSLDE